MQQEKDTKDVFDYIVTEKANYEARGVPVTHNWEFKMRDHIERTISVKNSKFWTGENDLKRPNKNIVSPILNVAYRSEGFDFKDIEAYVNNPDNYYKSLLVRKRHNKWGRKNNIDTFIDEMVESDDFGLILVKNVNDVRPEVVPLQRIAFCDQTDILSGPICECHQYSIDQLQGMKWDADAIDMAITQAKSKKNVSLASREAKTPGKYIEVYELHGMFPETWLANDGEEANYDETKYVKQLHIVTYYTGEDSKRKGIHLFKGKETKDIYKANKRTNRFGTACGMGRVEELFESSTWVNYSLIQLKEMLDAATLMILKTNDKKFANANQTANTLKNQVVFLEDGKDLNQLAVTAPNVALFENAMNQWEQSARTIGSASDPQLGLNPTSGTPLGTTEIVTNQGQGIHEYRRGQIASFAGEIWRDWVSPYFVNDLLQGDKWIDDLSMDEMQKVMEDISISVTNKEIKKRQFAYLKGEGKYMQPEEAAMFKDKVKAEFSRGGSKRFHEIVKDEFKDIPVDVEFNIAGKQKDFTKMVNGLNNVFRTVFANPAILQNPGMAQLFNEIIEYSGLSPVDFTSFTTPQPTQPQQPTQPAQPNQPTLSPLQPNQVTS